MKTLLILRHAKSSWKHEGLSDHERPLNKRGKRAAPRMGRWILEHDLAPEHVVCSTALRARRTADFVAKACGYVGQVAALESLYCNGHMPYVDALRSLSDDVMRALVVGHNPDVEELVFTFTGARERMPTAALAVVELETPSWSDLRTMGGGRLEALWRPRELPEE